MDPNDSHQQTSLSFSPPRTRTWDCRFHSDALQPRSHGAQPQGSSFSSHNKGSRSIESSDQHYNHHHSVSDGAVSYFGSPSYTYQTHMWTPPFRGANHDLRPHMALHPPYTEGSASLGIQASFNISNTTSPQSDAGPFEPSLKRQNFSTRRSFRSKPVYPLVFQNQISDGEEALESSNPSNSSRLTPNENGASTYWADATPSPDFNFQTTSNELHKMQASPDPSPSSQRDGFRWSSPSSFEFSFERDRMHMTPSPDLRFHTASTELPKMQASPGPSTSSSQREGFRWYSPNSFELGLERESMDFIDRSILENTTSAPTEDHKCGLCDRLLRQKSAWNFNPNLRSPEIPVTGVLSCGHVFHADCLEKTTPKSEEDQDPPCPLCMKTLDGSEGCSSILEERHVRSKLMIRDIESSDKGSGHFEGGWRRNRSLHNPGQSSGSKSIIKNRFKRHFSFKGKSSK
ncbi:hypothetical protein AMTRI_Chr01g126350 [Amborella trichopoda]|uniref:RING-type domain-containing protein n=1 Tax=Amborella trichopoda TaxID=13333 RepID=W1NQW0_AMBTC|nr:uncharacterized protein LOC18425162 isoform X2 [Amborella trichopoda]ERM97209.1 hypothetical protein AMTR_s00119p00055990 [Amborella trichopoda]|eukprot:XP_006829793.1 uncharacterized protein LOC18425162 isoform X2 [Amborella trichopoda]